MIFDDAKSLFLSPLNLACLASFMHQNYSQRAQEIFDSWSHSVQCQSAIYVSRGCTQGRRGKSQSTALANLICRVCSWMQIACYFHNVRLETTKKKGLFTHCTSQHIHEHLQSTRMEWVESWINNATNKRKQIFLRNLLGILICSSFLKLFIPNLPIRICRMSGKDLQRGICNRNPNALLVQLQPHSHCFSCFRTLYFSLLPSRQT